MNPRLPAVLLAAASVAAAQWSSDPAANLAVVTKSGEQVLPKIASTSDGGLWVGWFDNASGNYDVYVQRLDADGVAQFAAGGLLVSDNAQSSSLVDWDLVADSSDHCVLVFTDTRAGADLDVYAYRIAPDGTMVWGADGKTLSSNADFEPSPVVTETTDGDFVFVWARLPDAADGTLRMQRLDAAGTIELVANGVVIASQAGESPGFADIAPSTGGDVVVSWVRDISTFFSDRHVRAGRFDDAGASVWGTVSVFDAASVPIAHLPRIHADGGGGAFLSWHYSAGSDFDSQVQHLSAAGAELFPHDGVSVATTAARLQLDPTLSLAGTSGDVILFWLERNTAQSLEGVYAQKIDATGARVWGAGGVELLPLASSDKLALRSVAIGDGAAAFFAIGPFGNQQVRGIRVDAAGAETWAGSPIAVSTAASGKSRVPVTIGSDSVIKVVWEDTRNGAADLYAQNVNADGSLGPSGPWADLGFALAGTNGDAVLTGDGTLVGGTPVTLALSNALASTTTTLIVGAVAIDAPFKGGTLVPAPTVLVSGLPTDGSGDLDLASTWPVGLPPGVPIFFQHWIVDGAGPKGLAASNGLSGTTP